MSLFTSRLTTVLLLLVVLVAAALLPIALIWSLNTLFSLSIPFTNDTWVAAAMLLVMYTFFSIRPK